MDSTSAIWALQGWRDKLAAGFTHSAAPSGDKLGTLTQLAVFAAQHGMIWVGLGLPPTYAGADDGDRRHESPRKPSRRDGAVAPGGGTLPESDLETAEHLGRRVAEAAAALGRARAATNTRRQRGAAASSAARCGRFRPSIARRCPPASSGRTSASSWRGPSASSITSSCARRSATRSSRSRPRPSPCTLHTST